MKPTCLTQVRVFALFATSLIASGAAPAQAQTANLDIVGIKLGMPVKDALAALKTDKPKLSLQEQTLQLEGFDQPLLTTVLGSESGAAGKDSESLDVEFTMPPSKQVVWGIQRIYSYADQNKPSLDNTIAGLRKKYGPENISPDPDPRNMTKFMAWVFDAHGKPLAPGLAKTVNMACTSALGNAFGGGSGLRNDLAGTRGPVQCDSIIQVTASVQASNGIIAGSTVVYNLIVQIADGPMYRASVDATRTVAINANTARETKQKSEVDKRGSPKL
jgi:hypothetical protein